MSCGRTATRSTTTSRRWIWSVEPLIARPSLPGNVVPVREVLGEPVSQMVIGSSANPGYRDYAIAAALVRGRRTDPAVSFDVNPSSRQVFAAMTASGITFDLIEAGARIHQTGCLGCIGMGKPRGRAQLAADLPTKLPRPIRHPRRRGMAVLTRNSRSLGADR